MATELRKMVEDWADGKFTPDELEEAEERYFLILALIAMAKQIEANEAEIEKLKSGLIEPTSTIEPDFENVRSLEVERNG